MNAPRSEAPERMADTLFERRAGERVARLGAALDLVGLEPQRSQPWGNVGLRRPLRSRPAAGLFALGPHELHAERALGFELVVRAAAEPHVRHGGSAAARDRLDVV